MTSSHLGKLRKAAGYTQAQAAAKLPGRGQPLHKLSLSNIECGRGGASKVLLKSMARLYRCTIRDVSAAHDADCRRHAKRLKAARFAGEKSP